MATATKRFTTKMVMVPTIEKKEDGVIFSLSVGEAQMLLALVGAVWGEGPGRKVSTAIYYALVQANLPIAGESGFKTLDLLIHPTSTVFNEDTGK